MAYIERLLRLSDSNPDQITYIRIQVYSPVKYEMNHFGCEYTIGWPDEEQAGKMYGADSLQALMLALNMVAFFVYQSDFHKEGKLLWEVLGGGYGIPLRKEFLHLAEGDDILRVK